MVRTHHVIEKELAIQLEVEEAVLEGNLVIPDEAQGLILFAHGSGSSRRSPRNRYVARLLQAGGYGTLLFDLLTEHEEEIDRENARFRFNIELLAERLLGATDWLLRHYGQEHLRLGYFGASTGSAAALMAAARQPALTRAVVSRGGRPDLAGAALARVKSPTLLIVGENDPVVIAINQEACDVLGCEKELDIIPNAGHLFEEPGALDEVARKTLSWFKRYLVPENS